MGITYNTSIIKDGLRHSTDISNIKSYTSGSTITDLITGASGTSSIPNSAATWMNAGVGSITLTVAIKKLTGIPVYAVNPLTKYTNTTDNTFSWYVFGNNAGTTPSEDGRLSLYSNAGGTWGGIGSSYVIALNETVIATVQYNSASGGQLWINGVKSGTRTGRTGIFGTATNTSPIVVFTPPATSTLTMYYSSIYDRELTDSEIIQNFNALRGRYWL
jgi:hypothetical protein